MAAPAIVALDGFLIVALMYAVFTDLRWRRITNRLTYSAMLFGLAVNVLAGGWGGLAQSALGWLAGLGIMLLPFVFRAMGAGDVKLMAAIGALKGPHFVLAVALYAALAGGLLAVFYLVRERRMSSTARYVAYGWWWALKGQGQKGGSIPYAPAIAAGAVLALLPYSLLSL